MRVKICGLTRVQDIDRALENGADSIGIILYEGSPRFVPDENLPKLLSLIPPEKRVAVDVAPSNKKLHRLVDLGFHSFQLHFKASLPNEQMAQWSQIVGRDQLWLAPRLVPNTPFPQKLFEYADTFLIDTYVKGGYGGSGKTGNWPAFRQLQEMHPGQKWVLAGGLNPDNILAAIKATGTQAVDINSGIENAPGVKDIKKMDQIFELIST